MMFNELKEKASQLPAEPGVYLMKSEDDIIIYVGKAKNLKKRVLQYFDNRNKQIKVSNMVQSVFDFDFIITRSEADAFALECNLIKKYKPKYNILLKDDKNFPYLALNKNENYPKFEIVRKVKDDGKLYFGPFVTYVKVRDLLDLVNSAFKLPICSRSLKKISKRACIEGDMGNCSAPCIRAISCELYQKQINNAIDFLHGKTSKIKKILRNKMIEAGDNQDFEKAILFRNRLDLVKRIENKVLTNIPKAANYDLFAFVPQPISAIVVQFIRNGKTYGQKVEVFDTHESSASEILQTYIAQFYTEKSEIPNEIITSDNVSILKSYFFNMFNLSIRITCPQKGEKKELIDNAIKVAQKYIAQNRLSLVSKIKNSQGALEDLKHILQLDKMPNRIECYDISNTYGTNSVGSMVVFENGRSEKKYYRKFKIKTVSGSNDFASITEIIKRRFSKDESFGALPDLIVIDGGLGQLHAAQKALCELNVSIPIISLAKKEELIFTITSDVPIALLKNEPALKLLQRLRDEAHRFAIGYHRQLRQTQMFNN